MTADPTVLISCCVNDETGGWTGRVSAINVSDDIRLVAQDRGLKFADGPDDWIKIGHLAFRASGYTPYYGNLLWDAYEIAERDAVRLLRYLHKRRPWHLEEAPEEFWEKWETGRITSL